MDAILAARIELATQSVEPGGRLDYTVVNTGPAQVTLGETYELDRLSATGWDEVRLPYAFRLIGYALRPGERRELSVRVPNDARPGRHRVRKQLRPDRDPDPWNGWGSQESKPIEVEAEFDVAGTQTAEPTA